MLTRRGQNPGTGGLFIMRTRLVIPVILAVTVFLAEFVWKGRCAASGIWEEQAVDVGLFLVVGLMMTWWGKSVGREGQLRTARSEAAIEEKSRLLQQRNRQLQTVLQASRSVAAILDLPQISALIVEQVVACTRFSKAALVLAVGEPATYKTVVTRGLPEGYSVRLDEALNGVQRASSPVEWCRITRQPVVIESLARDFRSAGLNTVFAQAGAEGMIAVPLLFHEQFRGVLTLYVDKGVEPETAEVSLISALASQAATALESASRYAQVVSNGARLDKAFHSLQTVAAALAGTRLGVSTLLHLVAEVTAGLVAPARIHIVITKSGRQSPLFITEAAEMSTEDEGHLALSLPVSLDGDHLGQFEVYLGGDHRSLSLEETQTLQLFVHLTASAIGTASIVWEMRQAVEGVERAYMGTLEALTKALEMRDHETEGHCRRVVQYALSLAQQLDVSEEQLVPIIRGALLHDVGKIGIPDAILKKQGALTEAEWAVMRQHPRIGYQMLCSIEFLQEALPIILHHHERFNGSGYPDQLAGTAIPLGARIFAVADAYDALTSDRPYRKGRGHDQAIAEIVSCRGVQFDPQVVDALLSLPTDELARIRGRLLELVR